MRKISWPATRLSFVAERLNAVAHDLDSIEKKVQQYKSGQGAVDVSTQGTLYSTECKCQ